MTRKIHNPQKLIFPLSGWIEGYILSVEAAGRSPRTVRFYQWGLSHFAWWADEHGLAGLSALEPQGVRQFLRYLQTTDKRWGKEPGGRGGSGAVRPLSDSTVHAYVRTLKAFCSWLVEEGELDESPFRRVKTPPLPKDQVKPLTLEEVRALLVACKQHRGGQQLDGRWDLRDYAMVLVLLDTGLRVSELLSMRTDGITPTGEVTVIGKGKKQRTVFVSSRTRQAVNRWVRSRDNDNSDALWYGIRGPLTMGGVQSMLIDRARMAGIGHVHPHQLRHTSSVLFLRAGGESLTLMRMLGHTSLDQTRRYVLLADTDLADSHRRHSPIERWKL